MGELTPNPHQQQPTRATLNALRLLSRPKRPHLASGQTRQTIQPFQNTMKLHPVCIRTRKGWYLIEVEAPTMYEAVLKAALMPQAQAAKPYVEGC